VRGRDEEVLDHVVRPQLGSLDTPAAAVLIAVIVTARALDVAAAGNRDHHLLFGDEVLDRHVTVEAEHDLGAPVIAEFVGDLGELIADDGALTLRAGQD